MYEVNENLHDQKFHHFCAIYNILLHDKGNDKCEAGDNHLSLYIQYTIIVHAMHVQIDANFQKNTEETDWKVRILFVICVLNDSVKIFWFRIKDKSQKGRDLTQSYDKSPYTNRNVKRAKSQHKQRHKKFD